MKRVPSAVLLTLILGCTAIDQQRPQRRPDDLHFHNLQVLPVNIELDELYATMKGFTEALGVHCDHCHVRKAPAPQESFDFPSDAKPEKQIARSMIRMTNVINHDYLARVERNDRTVTCNTCHEGKAVPEEGTIPPRADRAPER